MTFEELKQRVEAEGLKQYTNFKFGSWGGGYNTVSVLKNSDGTVSYGFADERGSVFAEHNDIPEEKACDDLYQYAVKAKKWHDYVTERKKQKASIPEGCLSDK